MKKFALLFVLALVASVAVIGLSIHQASLKTQSDDPLVWEEDIVAFEALDAAGAPPRDAILFVGSSSIRLWHTLTEDMAPLPVIQRGFGGARMHDVVHYADRIITPYRAHAIVIFVGANDIKFSDTPMDAAAVIEQGLETLLRTIRREQPTVEVFYIAITPTIVSWEKFEAVEAANASAEAVLAQDPHAHFIATADLFLDENGEPDKTLYQFDGLHLSTEGYALWTGRIKPLLEAL